ncbi:hypothetical protein FACS1894217_09690 [Clostridia bacterium]|nr:hypothetical protein FACS1894217_09690 [Clostridia bacterium]
MYGADKNSCVLPCADGVVTFKVEAVPNYEIKPLTVDDLPEYAEVIRKSFATVAQDFGWVQDVAPTFTAYITDEAFEPYLKNGRLDGVKLLVHRCKPYQQSRRRSLSLHLRP